MPFIARLFARPCPVALPSRDSAFGTGAKTLFTIDCMKSYLRTL